MNRPRSLAALLALAFAVGGTSAAQLVQFVDGRVLRVEHVRRDAQMTELSLEGGGAISVPSSRISNLAEVEESRPSPPTPPDLADGTRGPWIAAAGAYAPVIAEAARKHHLHPALLTAMAEVESAFDAQAVSHKGARGLLQLMPRTAARFGVEDSFDPVQNVDGGAEYLSWLLDRFDGRADLALAGYNAGEGKVERYDGVPPYRETREYVAKVLAGFGRLAGTTR